VTIVPVVLGAGKPLFDRRLPGGAMQLTGVFPRANGMVELRYATQSGLDRRRPVAALPPSPFAQRCWPTAPASSLYTAPRRPSKGQTALGVSGARLR
jgi:hypothetical protein